MCLLMINKIANQWRNTAHDMYAPHFNSFQVAGPYLPQYEVYYKKLDPDGKGEIGAMDAAGFLKKSGLPDDVLGKVKTF